MDNIHQSGLSKNIKKDNKRGQFLKKYKKKRTSSVDYLNLKTSIQISMTFFNCRDVSKDEAFGNGIYDIFCDML